MSDLFRLRGNLEHWAQSADNPELVLAVEILVREVVARGGGSTRYVVTALADRLVLALQRASAPVEP